MALSPANRMLAYYLSGVGSAMGGPGSIAASVGGDTRQTIQTQNFMEVLGKMLSGLPQGSKMSADNQNFNLKMPVASFNLFTNKELEGMVGGGAATVGSPSEPTAQPGTLPRESNVMGDYDLLASNMLNPSVGLPDISSASLVGLSPKEISQALQFRMGYEELGQKRMSDLVDMIYKSAQISKMRAEEGLLGERVKPSDVRSYEYAQKQGFTGSLEDWKNIAMTTHEKDYDRAVEGGYTGTFWEYMSDLQRMGATRISLGELGAREEQRWDIRSRKYFTSKDFSADVQKYLNSTVAMVEWMSPEIPEEGTEAWKTMTKDQKSDVTTRSQDIAKAKLAAKWIRTKISASGGEITDVKRVGKKLVWTIKWPDGKTSEVKYAF